VTDASKNEPKSSASKQTWLKCMDFHLTKTLWDGMYTAYHNMDRDTRQDLCLMISVPVFIKDPVVALEYPTLGVQEIQVRLDRNLRAGPTSARVCVVDFNGDTQALQLPVIWDPLEGWFRSPMAENDWLPDPPKVSKNIADPDKIKDPERYRSQYRQFIEKTIKNPWFHQLNIWAVVQRVLEFYEEPQALGRPIPWGFDGNRLIFVPHAGFGQNAFYDKHSKSLQFYYFGDQQNPSYTCLSHDIIAHETGHAILDGVRPLYNQLSSVQTLAFHEFIADLTAILMALHNNDIRRFVANTAQGLHGANVMADLAKEFGQEVTGRDYLRTAFNDLKMSDVKDSLIPHTISQVLTGAMWEILVAIADKHLAKNEEGQKVTPAQALWWAAARFRRVALQPLDLCPPCDIQFIDYARAVIRNDVLTNPVDEQGYRPIMLDIFHKRGLCSCGYQTDKEMPETCLFKPVIKQDHLDFVSHDIDRISRSRTAAYYFLADNRRLLHIPFHQDVRVVDLYEASKLGAAAERLPREVVLEYAWQELVELKKTKELDFGAWNGKKVNLDCGGTLVFDDRGNLLSWFRKPGTEHISLDEARKLRNKSNPTNLDEALLDDLKVGEQRKTDLLLYLSKINKQGMLRAAALAQTPFTLPDKPFTVVEEDNVIHLEMLPHINMHDFEREEGEWLTNY